MKSKTLKFQLLNTLAKLPMYDHADDAAFGIFSSENKTLKPMETCLVATGISSEIPNSCFVSIRDRSSMAVKGLHVLAGVVDSGYRGEWKIVMINLSKAKYEIKIGDKIAQGILQDTAHPTIKLVKKLNTTERGNKGFGSTGR